MPVRYSVFWSLCMLLLFGVVDLQAQAIPGGRLCFVWYNVENLFYPENDSLPADDEFTPDGLRHWTWSRYREKLTAVAKVIVAAGGGEAPELIGLCEVENARVLEDLTSHPILAPYLYSYFHREGPDHRGMEVACLVRTGRIKTVRWETVRFAPPVTATRDMMHLSLSWGGDTLDLFLVHLLSKYGGSGATADLRRMQVEQLVQVMDSVYGARQKAWLLTAGDFNEVYGGYSMEALRNARFGGSSLIPLDPPGERGSYKYRGRWNSIDQAFVSLIPGHCQLSAGIIQLDPMLVEDLQYGGLKPRRSYEGIQYMGGISDHLPLVLSFTSSFFSVPGER